MNLFFFTSCRTFLRPEYAEKVNNKTKKAEAETAAEPPSKPKKDLGLVNFVKGGVMQLPREPAARNQAASANKGGVNHAFKKDVSLTKSGEELMARFMSLVLGDIEKTEPPVILVFQLKVSRASKKDLLKQFSSKRKKLISFFKIIPFQRLFEISS
jgi:hypothetical protein